MTGGFETVPPVAESRSTTISFNGWFFAIPTSLIRHKGRQPISVGFAITQLTLLFVSGTGSVAQIEDDEGRRLFTDAGDHPLRSDLETAEDRRLTGVAPWPWVGGLTGERLSRKGCPSEHAGSCRSQYTSSHRFDNLEAESMIPTML